MYQKSSRQQFLVLISVVSFFGSTAFGAVHMVSRALNQPQETKTTNVATAPVESAAQLQASQLRIQEQGYEVVLKQEPNNRVALEELVKVRLQMKNVKGAVEPLNQLVKFYPGKQEYKTVLAQVKQQVGK